jgi:hypothetical protein
MSSLRISLIARIRSSGIGCEVEESVFFFLERLEVVCFGIGQLYSMLGYNRSVFKSRKVYACD